jgi:hypothetical protein
VAVKRIGVMNEGDAASTRGNYVMGFTRHRGSPTNAAEWIESTT